MDDAHYTCALRISEQVSFGRGTRDVVSDHPQLSRFHHTILEVLIRSDCPRHLLATVLDGRDIVNIIGRIGLVTELLDFGQVWVANAMIGRPIIDDVSFHKGVRSNLFSLSGQYS